MTASTDVLSTIGNTVPAGADWAAAVLEMVALASAAGALTPKAAVDGYVG